MSRYCIWFVTPDDTVMRRAEVAINGSIHCHQVLEGNRGPAGAGLRPQSGDDCGLETIRTSGSPKHANGTRSGLNRQGRLMPWSEQP
jgi:hypothetical protein